MSCSVPYKRRTRPWTLSTRPKARTQRSPPSGLRICRSMSKGSPRVSAASKAARMRSRPSPALMNARLASKSPAWSAGIGRISCATLDQVQRCCSRSKLQWPMRAAWLVNSRISRVRSSLASARTRALMSVSTIDSLPPSALLTLISALKLLCRSAVSKTRLGLVGVGIAIARHNKLWLSGARWSSSLLPTNASMPSRSRLQRLASSTSACRSKVSKPTGAVSYRST